MVEIGEYLDYLKVPADELGKRITRVAEAALKQYGFEGAAVREIHETRIALIGIAKLRVDPPRGTDRFLLSSPLPLPLCCHFKIR